MARGRHNPGAGKGGRLKGGAQPGRWTERRANGFGFGAFDRGGARGDTTGMRCATVCLVLLAWGAGLQGQPPAREYYGARGEPRATVLKGAGQDVAGFADYVATLGPAHVPAFFMTYVGVRGTVESARDWGERLAHDLAPYPADVGVQVGLSFTTDGGGAAAQYGPEVAAGSHDARIDALAEALAALGRPVYVRIGYEFAGGWNGYDPESYRTAFRRITERMRVRCPDLATVWCAIPIDRLERHLEFYPGNDVVDWWGLDVFEPVMFSRPVAHDLMRAAHEHGKPVMIGEATPARVGADRGRVSWEGWYRIYFEFIDRWPGIKAVSYINWQWNATRWAWLDARLSQLDGYARDEVLERLRSERFRPALAPSPTTVHRLVARTDRDGAAKSWRPDRPADWEGRRGAGAGLMLAGEEARWLTFDLGAVNVPPEDLVRAELWVALWPAEGGQAEVRVAISPGSSVGTLRRRDGGYTAMRGVDLTGTVREALASGRSELELGLRREGAVAVAIDGPDDPDPFEPQLFLWLKR